MMLANSKSTIHNVISSTNKHIDHGIIIIDNNLTNVLKLADKPMDLAYHLLICSLLPKLGKHLCISHASYHLLPFSAKETITQLILNKYSTVPPNSMSMDHISDYRSGLFIEVITTDVLAKIERYNFFHMETTKKI